MDSKTADPRSECLPWALPSQRLERVQTCIQTASAQDDFDQMVIASQKGLEISPLNWQFHFLKAAASVQLPLPDVQTARRSFAAARLLQPRWVTTCLEEGRLWLQVGESGDALKAFEEALQRGKNSPLPYDGLFQTILEYTGPRPELRQSLRTRIGQDPTLLLLYLRGANPGEWNDETRRLLEEKPAFHSFSSGQRQTLFQLWYERGNRDALIVHLQKHPQLQRDGWRCLALRSIDEGSYQGACQLALQHAPKPAIPALPISEPLSQLERRFAQQPTDVLAGITLLLAQQRAGNHRDALRILGRIRNLPSPPPYLSFLQFQLHAALGEWEAAWRAWNG